MPVEQSHYRNYPKKTNNQKQPDNHIFCLFEIDENKLSLIQYEIPLPEASMPDNDQPRQAQPEEWLDQHGDALYKFAMLRLGNTHLAEDMVQETLIKGMRGFEKFRGDASVRTWLFQILRNEISSYFRSAKRSARKEVSASDSFEETDLLHPLVSTQKFQSLVEKEEFWAVIQTCFERIPDHLLDSFLVRLANPDEKVDILCNQLGINASNFSVRLFRARLMLRKCLESNWFNV